MLFEDLWYAIRMLLQRPAFTSAVILILALGIGANTAVFSVLDAVLLKPLPYSDPGRIVTIWDTNQEQGRDHEGPSPANLEDWRARSASFEGIASWYAGKPVTLQSNQDAEKISVAEVTADFFEVFGRTPVLGRAFDAAEYRTQERVVVLSHGIWQSRFGSDAGVVGSRIVLDGNPHTVVGVMAPDFSIPNREVGFWRPWNFAVGYASRRGGVPRDARFLRAAARLKAGVTIEQAQNEMERIVATLASEYPAVNRGWGVRLIPLHEEFAGNLRPILLVLFGAVAFVLLIACTNIANLLLARASGRDREIAVRTALGASRVRIIRQLLTESVALAAGGAILGLVFASFALPLLTALAPAGIPRLDEISIDARVFTFTAFVAILTGLVFGTVPALHSSNVDIANSLKEGGTKGATAGHRTQRFRSVLAAAEIAAALTLLVGAGLVMRSFAQLVQVDPGFDPKNVLVVRAFPDERTYADSAKRLAYFKALFERFAALPSVESVGATTGLPLSEFNNAPSRPYWAEGEPRPDASGPMASLKMTTANYFKTMGISLLAGRDFSEFDDLDAPPVTVINTVLAERVWPGQNAVGKRMVIDYGTRGIYPHEVIGVVESSRVEGLRKEAPPEIFIAETQVPYAQMNIVVRTSGDPMLIAKAAQREVLQLDPTQPVHSMTTMEQLFSRSVAQERFSLVLIVVMAVLALVLALSGVYGLMSYVVSQRMHEIGVRMALGAKRNDVTRLIMGHAAGVAVVGALAGFVISLVLTRAMSTMLFEVSSTDPVTFLAAAVLLVTAALLASYIPTRRATRIDPIRVLRSE